MLLGGFRLSQGDATLLSLGDGRERLLLGGVRLSQGDMTLFFLGDGSERLLLGGFKIPPADTTLFFQVRKNMQVTRPCERYLR